TLSMMNRFELAVASVSTRS
ncbi:hypothetical protein D030_4719B, partial [Vibrio parahaemolyticus AQ3810]